MGSSIDVASTGQLVNQLMNPPNPWDQFAKTMEGINAYKNFQAKAAEADAYRQSVDPQTGAIDLGRYNALLSQNPAGGWNFGAAAQQAGQAVGQQGLGTQQDVKAKLDQMSALQAYMGPLYDRIQNKQPVTGQDVLNAMNTAPPGLVTPELRAHLNQQVQSVGGPTGDASGIVMGGYYANEHAMDILKSRFPNYGAITTGGTIYPTQTNPTYPGRPGEAGGVQYPTQGLPTTPSGTEMVTLTVGTQTIPNVPANVANAITQNPSLLQSFYPTQAQQMQPGDRISVSGAGGRGSAPGHYPTPTAAGGGGGAPVPQPPASPERISVPPAATAPLWRQPPGPLPAEAGGVGLTPQQGYQTNIVEPSQKAATALSTGAGQTSDINALIDDMRSQVNQPGWNSGLGAQAGSTWRQVLQRLGVNANPGAAPAQIDSAEAAQNEFAKDANLIASRQLAAIGNPSDARQGLAEAITPGLAQSKEGVLGITATLKGNQDAINRTNTAWQQAKANGWSGGRHLEWLNNNWKATDPATGGRFDPRVFWLADTAGNANDQWRRFASKIPQDQQPQFLKNVQFARNQGWIKQNDDQSFAVVSP